MMKHGMGSRLLMGGVALLGVVIVALLLTARGGEGEETGQRAASGQPSKPFVVNYSLAPATIDPSEASNLDDGLISNLYVTLTQYGTKKAENGYTERDFNKIEPSLAESWTSADGDKTWTFKLHAGAQFPDGSPMDSGAVKYSLERLLTRGATGAAILNGNREGLVESIEAPDSTTVVISLKEAYPTYPQILTSFQAASIVNPRLVEANGGIDKEKPNEWMASHSAGGGPYVLEEYEPGRRAVLVANKKFFGTPPLEPRVIVNFVKSDSTLLLQATSGEADVTVGLTYESIASLKDNDCCAVAANVSIPNAFLSLPNKHKPFDNRTFREALSYAVPYEGIRESVMHGYADSFFGPFPPGNTNYNAEIGGARDYDVEKAKQLLADSGVKTPVKFDLLTAEGQNDFAQVATIVKDAWREIGVDVSIKTLSASAFVEARNKPDKKYGLLVQFGGVLGFPYWVTNYDARCGHLFNTSDYCNKDVTRLIDEAFLAPEAEQQALWDDLARRWVRDVPRIPVYSPHYVVALKKGVRNYHYTATPLAIWRWGR
jgi:peptide/nickel transport system substrate-binding protein